MTVPSRFPGLVLAGLGSLLIATAGLAESRLMPDPDGLLGTASFDGPHCCAAEGSATVRAGSTTVAAAPAANSASSVVMDEAAPWGAGQAGMESSPEAPFASKSDDLIRSAASPPQSPLKRLLSSLIQLGGAAAR
jgi:hypothetical protein